MPYLQYSMLEIVLLRTRLFSETLEHDGSGVVIQSHLAEPGQIILLVVGRYQLSCWD